MPFSEPPAPAHPYFLTNIVKWSLISIQQDQRYYGSDWKIHGNYGFIFHKKVAISILALLPAKGHLKCSCDVIRFDILVDQAVLHKNFEKLLVDTCNDSVLLDWIVLSMVNNLQNLNLLQYALFDTQFLLEIQL